MTVNLIFIPNFFFLVASSPDSKTKPDHITGATSSEHEIKGPFDEKSGDSEQSSQISPSAPQQPSTPTINGLISSECIS